MPQVRGGHPEQREPGGGWGVPVQRGDAPDTARTPAGGPPPGVVYGPGPGTRRRPRQEYIDAFDDDVFATAGRRTPVSGAWTDASERSGGPGASGGTGVLGGPDVPGGPERRRGGGDTEDAEGAARAGSAWDAGGGRRGRGRRGGRSRTFTGVAAAAVTTVLAVVVAGQVADARSGAGGRPGADGGERMGVQDSSRSAPSRTGAPPADPPTAARSGAAPATYADRMGELFDLDPGLSGSGRLVPVAGRDKAPGTGERVRYRVDVEKGLPLDGKLFAEAVHRTLNDDRSWGHGGVRTFERVSGTGARFVITLASPGTTAVWCARSGLDTTVDNVSCDSAATERVMINAYRWARGARTFGPDRIREYREMLINHEVGHRLGKGHAGCPREGALAPVMMQQTKYLNVGGPTCRPNAWPFPGA